MMCASDLRPKGVSRLLLAMSPKARVCGGMGLYQCSKVIYTAVLAALIQKRDLRATYSAFKTTSSPGTSMQKHILHTLQAQS